MLMNRNDLKEALSFSVSRNIKDRITDRAKALGISRSDYINVLILADLQQGIDAPLQLRPAGGVMQQIKPRRK
jgi:hypothetical protein